MALSDSTKIDIAFKKLISQDYTDTDKQFYEENSGGGFNVATSDILSESIPSSVPVATTTEIKVYTDAADGALKLTEDVTVASEGSWLAKVGGNLVGDWIPPKFHQDYTVKVYEDDGTGLAKGSQIFTTDAADWFFDYETGILTFQDTHSFTTPIWIEAYRYIGDKLNTTIKYVPELSKQIEVLG